MGPTAGKIITSLFWINFRDTALHSPLYPDCRAVLLVPITYRKYSQLHARGDSLGLLEGLKTLYSNHQSGETQRQRQPPKILNISRRLLSNNGPS